MAKERQKTSHRWKIICALLGCHPSLRKPKAFLQCFHECKINSRSGATRNVNINKIKERLRGTGGHKQARATIPIAETASELTSELVKSDIVEADELYSFGAEHHEHFLREYWQKKPVLIRQAVPGFEGLLSKDELAGLACCPDAESRVIQGGRSAVEESDDWEVAYGPFEEQVFAELGENHWTLLVNEVNRHIPEVSDLLQRFRFVPNWRVDDIMVSYAPKGGSVGPHVDNYDVFLLQGAGKRRWSIENRPISDEEEQTRSIKEIDVRVLADFHEAQTWILEPGDALYIPPRIAHHGVSLDDTCMTYSVGFRAPSHRDLVAFFGDHVASTRTKADHFYSDPDLRSQDNPGLIHRDAISRAKEVVREAFLSVLQDGDAFDTWFGQQVSRSRRDHSDYPMPMEDDGALSVGYQTPHDVTDAVRRTLRRVRGVHGDTETQAGGPFVYHAEGLTFAYIEHEDAKGATLFVDGNVFPVSKSCIVPVGIICEGPRLSPQKLGAMLDSGGVEMEQLIHDLLKQGFLYPADD